MGEFVRRLTHVIRLLQDLYGSANDWWGSTSSSGEELKTVVVDPDLEMIKSGQHTKYEFCFQRGLANRRLRIAILFTLAAFL